jgi:DNA-binding XRE family transcriptional regulator
MRPYVYLGNVHTLGDHIRKRRIEIGLSQRQAGAEIGVRTQVIHAWESGEARPRNRHVPSIIRFLGYDPVPRSPQTLSEALRTYRRRNGLTQTGLAKILGVARDTIA